jgi:aspartate aminotransferase-like enzyme
MDRSETHTERDTGPAYRTAPHFEPRFEAESPNQRALERYPDATERLDLRTSVDIIEAKNKLLRKLSALPFIDSSRINASTSRKDDADKPVETLFDITVRSMDEMDAVCAIIENDDMPWGMTPIGQQTSAKGYFLTKAAELKEGFLGHIGLHLDFKAHNPVKGDGQGHLSNSSYRSIKAEALFHENLSDEQKDTLARFSFEKDPIKSIEWEEGSNEARINTSKRTLHLDHEGNLFEVRPFTLTTQVYDKSGDGPGTVETRVVPFLEELISLNNRKPCNDRVRTFGGIAPDVINRIVGKWCPDDLTTFESIGIGAGISSGSEGPSRINPAEYVVKLKVRDQSGVRIVTGEEAKLYVGLNGFAGTIVEATIEVYRDPKEEFTTFLPIKDPKGRGKIDLSPDYPNLESVKEVLESGDGKAVYALWRRVKQFGEFADATDIGEAGYIDRLADSVEAMADVDHALDNFTSTQFVPADKVDPDVQGQASPPLQFKAKLGEHLIRGEEIMELANLIFIIPKLSPEQRQVTTNMILWMMEHGCMAGFLANGKTTSANHLEYELAFMGNGEEDLSKRHAHAADTLVQRKRAVFNNLGDASKLMDEAPHRAVRPQAEIIMAKVVRDIIKDPEQVTALQADFKDARATITQLMEIDDEECTYDCWEMAIEMANDAGSNFDLAAEKEKLIDEIMTLLKYILDDKPSPLVKTLYELNKGGHIAFDPRETEGLTHVFVGEHEMGIARGIREWTAEGPRSVSGPNQSSDGQMIATTLEGRRRAFKIKADTLRQTRKAGLPSWLYGHGNTNKGSDMHHRKGKPVQNPPDVHPSELVKGIHLARQREAAVNDGIIKGITMAYYEAIEEAAEDPDSGIETKYGEKGMNAHTFRWLLRNKPELAVKIYNLLERAGIEWSARCPLVMPTKPRRTNIRNIVWPSEACHTDEADTYDEAATLLCRESHRGQLWQRIQEELHGQLRDKYKLNLRERSFVAESTTQAVESLVSNLIDQSKEETHLDLRRGKIPETIDPSVTVVVISDPKLIDHPQLKDKRKILALKDEREMNDIKRWADEDQTIPSVDAIVIDGRAYQTQNGAKRPFATIITNIETIKHRIKLRQAGNPSPGPIDLEWLDNNPFKSKQTPPMKAIFMAVISQALNNGQQPTLEVETLLEKRTADRAYRTVAPGPSEQCPAILTSRLDNHATEQRLRQDPEGQKIYYAETEQLAKDVLGIPPQFRRFPTRSDTSNMDRLRHSIRPGTTIVGSVGSFGERQGGLFAEISEEAVFVRPPSGTGFNSQAQHRQQLLDAVKDATIEPIVVTLTHHETSRGVRNDVSSLARDIKHINANAIVIVDSTSIFPVEIPNMTDEDGNVLIDALHCSHQKAMGKGSGGNGEMYVSPSLLEVTKTAGERGHVPGRDPHLNQLIEQIKTGQIEDLYSVIETRSILEYIRDNGGIKALQVSSRRKLKQVFDWIDQHEDLSCSVPAEDVSPSMVHVNVGLEVDTSRVVECARAENIGVAKGYDTKADSLRVFISPWLSEHEFGNILTRLGEIIRNPENRLLQPREISYAPGHYEESPDYSNLREPVGLAAK